MPESTSPAVYDRAILWVAHPTLMLQRVGGMSVLERQLFTASRAGVRTIWISMIRPPEADSGLRVPEGLEVRWLPKGGGELTECAPPYLGLSGDHFLRVETLAHVARARSAESLTYEDASGFGVAQVTLTRDEATARAKLPLPEDSYLRLESPIDGEETVDWLLLEGPKAQDGFMARHFDRHLSLSVSRRLLDTSVSPNMMTLLSTAVGALGAALFLLPGRSWGVLGALTIWLHSVLDGCDGELARVRFQQSPLGADLDFWGDNVVHLALFTGLGFGLRRAHGPVALALAAAADAGAAASALTAWRRRRALRRPGATGPEAEVAGEPEGKPLASRLARLENALAQRDFIYLLLAAAALGLTYEFLWAAAAGSALYFAVMFYLGRIEHESSPSPNPAG